MPPFSSTIQLALNLITCLPVYFCSRSLTIFLSSPIDKSDLVSDSRILFVAVGLLTGGVVTPGKMALITGSSHVLTGQTATEIHGPHPEAKALVEAALEELAAQGLVARPGEWEDAVASTA